MNVKKLLVFSSILPMLISCNNKSIAGTYGFQMGKENGTHFGIFLNLSDEKYNTSASGDYKKFLFTMSVSFPEANNKDSDDPNDETSSAIENIMSYFKDDETGDIGVPGYYRLTDDLDKHGEKILKLGLDFNYVYNIISNMTEDMGESTIPEEADLSELNDNALIESILYASYKSNEVDVYIPVSVADVYYQLYWYGIDVKITIDSSLEYGFDFELLETEKHQLGSHPTKDEVEEINKTFKDTHEKSPFTTFRDFNVVKLGLLKK